MLSDLRKESRARRSHLSRSNTGSPNSLGGDLFISALATRTSSASLISNVSSHRSSAPSVQDTVQEYDDDETCAIRRLLLRKIDSTLILAVEEIDISVVWLRVVTEVVRGVKRRAYL